MSSIPGYTLEAFLMWNYDLIVDGDGSANPSLQIAEACGTNNRRQRITSQQFAPVVAVYEPYRDRIEAQLDDYDEEENGSWRDYAGYAFDFIPAALFAAAGAALPTGEKP